MRAIAIAAVLFVLALSAGCGSGSTLKSGAHGSVGPISCAAPGDCAAAGYYLDRHSRSQAFVVSETNGTWGNAIEVPGTAKLNSGGSARVTSISCPAAGECAASGTYTDASKSQHVFVVSETSGSWGTAIEVPGTATPHSRTYGTGISISCAAVGDCAAGGSYTSRGRKARAFVVSETDGSWTNAVVAPGTATLGASAGVDSVSCPAAGECAASGSYTDGRGTDRAFVVSETNGRWGTAIKMHGYGQRSDVAVASMSCGAAGDCAAGGSFSVDPQTIGSSEQTFVVSEANGRWGDAIGVPGTETSFDSNTYAGVDSISCTAAGECAAGGYYHLGGWGQAFVVSETNGSWGEAIKVPGTVALNTGLDAAVGSISCAAPGDCAAGGYYTRRRKRRAFVVSETNGSWGEAVEIPGSVSSVSCAAAGGCAASGSGTAGAFVVSETNGKWGSAIYLRLPAP